MNVKEGNTCTKSPYRHDHTSILASKGLSAKLKILEGIRCSIRCMEVCPR